mmetsp:Transcript_33887/g.91728  ORF Transcript_33887/g.91728 Transcript_33887/m.91728 type:complete len:220 (+) Transcript_33887:560-1219(+)
MPLGLDYLGRQVFGRSAQRPRPVLYDLGEAEVRDLHVSFAVDEQVLRLQVAIHDVQRVKVGEGQYDLPRVEARAVVGQPPFLTQVREELPAVDVLQKHEEALLILEGREEVHDERMLYHCHDLLLRSHVLHLLQSDDFALLHYLDGQGSPVFAILDLHHAHPAKSACADRSSEVKVGHGPQAALDQRLDVGYWDQLGGGLRSRSGGVVSVHDARRPSEE